MHHDWQTERYRFLQYTFLSVWGKCVKMYGLWLERLCYCTCPQQEVTILTIPKNFKKKKKKLYNCEKHIYQMKKKVYKYKKKPMHEVNVEQYFPLKKVVSSVSVNSERFFHKLH